MPKLSILIPSLNKRSGHLKNIIRLIGTHEYIEVITHVDDGQKTTGHKRNELIEAAKGDYFVFIDDDDHITPEYIPEILKAIDKKPDVICFNGWMTECGRNRRDFFFSLNYPYSTANHNGKQVYLRYPNHLCPMKHELVKDIKFPNITIGEDFDWATRIHKAGILKTQVIISKFLYHYQYNPLK